jgi:serine/threonine protein phosphatase PrpC
MGNSESMVKNAGDGHQARGRSRSILNNGGLPKPLSIDSKLPIESGEPVQMKVEIIQSFKTSEQSLAEHEILESVSNSVLPDRDIQAFWTSKCSSYAHSKLTLQGVPGRESDLVGSLPPAVFVTSVKGNKGYGDSSPSQDTFCYAKFGEYEFHCVFDGHGPSGHFMAYRAARLLPFYVTSNRFFGTNVSAAIQAGFISTHNDMINYARQIECDCEASGTTGTLMLRRGAESWFAHVGDSRGLIGVRGDQKSVIFETIDHKPTDPSERARIDSSGGEVREFRHDKRLVVHRVFVRGEEYPGLCMTRSLGDNCV